MKKTYIAPQLAVYHPQLSNIIAASPLVGIDSDSSVDAGLVDVKGSGDWDIWGNDDSDDEY